MTSSLKTSVTIMGILAVYCAQFVPDLLCRTPWGGIGNGPRCLLPCAKLCYLQDIDERRQQTCIYHHLQEVGNNLLAAPIVSFSISGNKKKEAFFSSLVCKNAQHTCICALFPAVMLEIVQHASFLIDSLGLLRSWSRDCSAEQFRIT